MAIFSAIFPAFPRKGQILHEGILIVLTVISITGVFLMRNGKTARFRPGYVPLLCSLIVVLATEIYGLLALGTPAGFGRSNIMLEGVEAIGTLLLAPSALVFFIVMPGCDRFRSVVTGLTMAITGVAVLGIWLVVKDLPRAIDPALGLVGLYWFIGMPLIGLCFVACAVSGKNREKGDAPA